MKIGLNETLFAAIIGLFAFFVGYMSGSDEKISDLVSKCTKSPNLIYLKHRIYVCKKFVNIKGKY